MISLNTIKADFFLAKFLFFGFEGRKPSKQNLPEGKPLVTRAVVAAHGPGMQIIFKPIDLTS